jgi:hypothetical protein
MPRSFQEDLEQTIVRLQRCVTTDADSTLHLWAADLSDALFDVARALRGQLQERASSELDRAATLDRLRASLLQIVEGLETEVLNSRWRLLSMRQADRMREYLALRFLARFLVAALRNLQADELLTSPPHVPAEINA